MNIIKPTLILDEAKCKANIVFMANKAKKHNVVLRPHFKTHQSLDIGRWFKDVGITKITVSSLDMAEYFAEEWNDITVAFPVNILEIETINRLAKKITLNVLVESVATAQYLMKHLNHSVNFLIKLNIGNGRTGLLPNHTETINAILEATKQSSKLHFIGFLGHAGQTYNCRSKAEIQKVHDEAKTTIVSVKNKYKIQYPKLIASYGDTPSCSVAENFEGLDELRPGNFVFYDVMQVQIGDCTHNDIAVAMACPIVSIHKDRNELVIYGGGIHFSKDRIEHQGKTIFGIIAQNDTNGWNDPIPNMYVKALSQEHGVVVVPPTLIDQYNIGDLIYVLPIHSCMTADLMKRYKTLDGNDITMMLNH
ncbi:MAG: alanine racemase [Flavobacteriaceae bacterium]|nr:alanine racemase [Flavobacteriaceae bacterium]